MQVDVTDAMPSNTDYEAELLGADTPTATITDILNESLLGTPSQGVLDTEPTLNEGVLPESAVDNL